MKAIIIHSSGLIQSGLKNILQSKNIIISEIFDNFPDFKNLNCEEVILFVDEKYEEFIRKEFVHLKKKKNYIIGICAENKTFYRIDEVLYLTDNFFTLSQKIDSLLPKTDTNNSQLSSREIEILSLVAKGLSNKIIAEQLFISIHTVITHRKNITTKLGIKTIAGLTLYASINNLI